MKPSMHVVLSCMFILATGAVLGAEVPAQVASPGSGSAAGSYLSLSVYPRAAFPLPLNSAMAQFLFSGSATLSGLYTVGQWPFLNLIGEAGYQLSRTDATSLSVLSAGAGVGFDLGLTQTLGVFAQLTGGGYYLREHATSDPLQGASAYLAAGAGLYYLVTPRMSIGVSGRFIHQFGFLSSAELALGTTWHFAKNGKTMPGYKPQQTEILKGGRAKGENIILGDVAVDTVFPVFSSYYDMHPVGSITVTNREREPINGVRVTLLIREYMDAPKGTEQVFDLPAGASRRVDLFALLKEKVLTITEPTKAAAEIEVEYTWKGKNYYTGQSMSVQILDRNAMTWDDDRKAAAFVSSKDPSVMSLAKNATSAVKDRMGTVLDKALASAMAVHEGLRVYGISYQVDPKSAYTDFSRNQAAVDYLQYPRQTLEYHSGDCDDLSILYSSLLEAVNVRTAFITIPGHIYIAFALGMPAEEAKRALSRQEDLVFTPDGTAWVPFEVTETSGGFLKAWETGAREWRENTQRALARIYPVDEARKLYGSTGLPADEVQFTPPRAEQVRAAFLAENARLVTREIGAQAVRLRDEADRSQSKSRPLNALAVLYCRYGMWEEAERQLAAIIQKEEYVPALINLGNLLRLQERYDDARSFLARAQSREPDNPKAILGLAQVNHFLENYGEARRLYDRLKTFDAALAQKYAYLELRAEEASRAAEAGGSAGTAAWAE